MKRRWQATECESRKLCLSCRAENDIKCPGLGRVGFGSLAASIVVILTESAPRDHDGPARLLSNLFSGLIHVKHWHPYQRRRLSLGSTRQFAASARPDWNGAICNSSHSATDFADWCKTERTRSTAIASREFSPTAARSSVRVATSLTKCSSAEKYQDMTAAAAGNLRAARPRLSSSALAAAGRKRMRSGWPKRDSTSSRCQRLLIMTSLAYRCVIRI